VAAVPFSAKGTPLNRTLLTLAVAALPGMAAAVALPSSISEVTVYPDRAVVTRLASAQLSAGEHELELENLPAGLQESSVQASARAAAPATLIDVQVRNAYPAGAPNPRVRALEEELRGLDAKLAALDDEKAVLDNQRELVLLMQRGATDAGQGAPRPTEQDFRTLQSLSADALARALSGLRDVAARRGELERRRDALAAQIESQRDRQRASKTAVLRLRLAESSKVEVKLAYAVRDARWTPAYDARLQPAQRTVQLGYFGVVRQHTGEDWNQVRLTLSTARPSLGGAAPEPRAWIVDVAAPQPPAPRPAPAASRPRAFGQARLEEAAEAAGTASAADEPLEAEAATAQLENAATSAAFRIQAPASLPSDDSAQRVAIATATLPATLVYRATPGLRETAYLSAQAENSTGYPLLAGPLNTFLGDAFVAAGALKTVMPGEKLDLAMGADDGIAIERKLVSRYTENTGFSGSGRRVTYEYRYTVRNHKQSAETLEFRDSIPVSRNERIAVKVLAPSAQDARREADGRIAWHWKLAPGESREATLKFAVEYPGDVDVYGL